MEINDVTILKYRIKHPNCLYCQHLAEDRYVLYHCKQTHKNFLFGNRIKAYRCKYYVPKTNDLEIAKEAFKKMQKMGGF